MNRIKIITTADGSHSLLNEGLNETYHSVHGAIAESRHVFIQHGLAFFLEQNPVPEVRVLEVGYGTALNALLALQFARDNHIQLHYTAVEAMPLAEEIWSVLNYSSELGDHHAFASLHKAPWDRAVEVTPGFTLQKIEARLENTELRTGIFDVIFFDAFAPSKQPEMWTLPILAKVAETVKPGGVFVTYCAKGQLKRDLRTLYKTTETLPGPPGKREMLRAVK